MSIQSNFPAVKPTLLLDFANTKELDPRVTFTRASTATYFDANGLLKSEVSGAPRFDHNPVTGECLGLLVEEARTNIATYSEDFSNAAWTKTRSSVTANGLVSPDGTTTADKLIEDTTATNSHFANQTYSLTANQTYTLSVFAKAGENTQIVLQTGNVANWVAERQCGFNLSTGAMFSTGLGTTFGTITPVGNGWYRCSITATFGATSTNGALNILLAKGNQYVYTGDGVSGAFIWGAQVEAGAFLSSYIPTVASQVTRAIDVASMTGTNFTSWYRADEGALFAEFTYGYKLGGVRVAGFNDGTTNNMYEVVAASGSAGSVGSGVYWSGNVDGTQTINANNAGTTTPAVLVKRRFAGAYKVNDFANSTDGGAIGSDTSTAVPVVNTFTIGTGSTGTPQILCGHIGKIAYYPVNMTDAQLKALSS
jgi:hypothetical protein